jgi:tRNA A-37 threonylcarbamoyl transferase component Bud32/ActR/RegA family two-component response regulator
MNSPVSKTPSKADRQDSNLGARGGRASSLCLIVHDDLELRLQAAALMRRASPTLAADSVDQSAFAAMSAERIAKYKAVLVIIEFASNANGGDPLANVARMRDHAPRTPVFVFARGGDERCAARSIKCGAADYWPIHAVKLDELRQALLPLAEQSGSAGADSGPGAGGARKAAEPRRQPEIGGYRLMKKIAQSAAASVYLAQSDELAQPVALKVQALGGLRIGAEADRQRFARECEILSALNHRSIADVLDFGITDEYLFLALEYFPCGSLRERMRNPVSEADAINYTVQIGQALEIVHAAHVVHCDLKPSNIMLTNDNRIVLIDFGSARSQLLSTDLSRSDISTGTPYYVCPEQIMGREPDGRGDLYSLGVILFEMLAGAPPFAGKTLSDIFAAHRLADVPPLPAHRSRYQSVVNRLLAKDPAHRYTSAGEFLRALGTAIRPTTVGPPARPANSQGVTVS